MISYIMYSPRLALAVCPDVHIHFVSCERMRRKRMNIKNTQAKTLGIVKNAQFFNALKKISFQLHCLTFFDLLMPNVGTSVGDNDNDKGQQHICTDDACYCPWLNSVARHSALWQTQAGSGKSDKQRSGMEDVS